MIESSNEALQVGSTLFGMITTYNDDAPRPGPNNIMSLVINRGRMEGFIIMDYLHRAEEAIGELAGWVLGGELKFAVDVVDGLDNAPVAMDRLFTGANQGRVMVRLSERRGDRASVFGSDGPARSFERWSRVSSR